MPRQLYSLTWHGESFRFFRLRDDPEGRTTDWAVARAGEFIGTMACGTEITTKEFEVWCALWLSDLLGSGAERGAYAED